MKNLPLYILVAICIGFCIYLFVRPSSKSSKKEQEAFERIAQLEELNRISNAKIDSWEAHADSLENQIVSLYSTINRINTNVNGLRKLLKAELDFNDLRTDSASFSFFSTWITPE